MSDIFVLLDNVPYSKNDFQNRNRIRTSGTDNGWCWLTVPVLTKGRFGQSINEVEINNADIAWRKRCWNSIRYNYTRAKHFNEYKDFFLDLYLVKSWDKLADLNIYIIEHLKQVLEIDVKLVPASNLSISGSGTELLLEICQELGAETYISGRFGKDYLNEELFNRQGIQVVYQEFQHPKYPQVYEPFIPNLSVIDLSFNCGKRSREIICKIGCQL